METVPLPASTIFNHESCMTLPHVRCFCCRRVLCGPVLRLLFSLCHIRNLFLAGVEASFGLCPLCTLRGFVTVLARGSVRFVWLKYTQTGLGWFCHRFVCLKRAGLYFLNAFQHFLLMTTLSQFDFVLFQFFDCNSLNFATMRRK